MIDRRSAPSFAIPAGAASDGDPDPAEEPGELDDTLLDRLELELRSLPGVAAVAMDRTALIPTMQLLTTDPTRRMKLQQEAQELVTSIVDVPLRIQAIAPSLPSTPLRLEVELASMPDVANCRLERGPRGEVRRIRLVAGSAGTARARILLAERYGQAFVDRRLTVTEPA